MADSSKSTGLGKPLDSAKSNPGKEGKKKRKRSKKFGRAKFNENLESKSQECSAGTSPGDEQNVEENDGDSKVNMGEKRQIISKEEIEEEGSTQHGDEMAAEGKEQVDQNNEQIVNKDVPQDPKLVRDSTDGKQEVKSDIANEKEDADNSKKTKRSSLPFLRGSKRFSKSRLSHGEDKSVQDTEGEGESSGVETKGAAGKESETSEQKEEEMYDEAAKSELGAIFVDMKSKEFDESPGGVQERPINKSNKGKKLKQFASFGRNKKKPDIAMKGKEDELPDSETQESAKEESPVRAERSGSKRSQNIDATSNEPAALDNSNLTNESFATRTEENERKDAGNVKRKGSFLGLKRSKQHPKKKKASKSEDELNAELNKSEKIPASKSDDVSAMEGVLLEEKTDETEEKSDLNAAKTADVQMEETSGETETKDESNKEEMSSPEIKANEGATGGVEETSQASTNKDKKSSILRSFRKRLSPNNKSQQGKKKAQENENIVNKNDEDEKKMEQSDKDENSEPKQTTEDETTAETTKEEGSFDAVKRKTSDLKNIGRIQAMKRKKNDYEKCEGDDADSEDYDECDEDEEQEAIANDQTAEEFTKEKDECVDEFNPQANNELSKQKNYKEEQTENKESGVQDEISREPIARDDTQDEDETSSEAQGVYREQMKTVIDELVEVMEKREERIGKENCVQGEENVESSTDDKAGSSERPASEIDETDEEEDTDEEAYDSDLTIVSEIVVSSINEPAAEHKTEPKPQDEEIRQTQEGESSHTEKPQVADTKSEGITEPNTGDEEKRIIYEEKSLETELPEVAETNCEDTTEPKPEDEKESSETEALQVSEPQVPVDQKRETTTEDAEQYSEKSEASESPVDQDAEESMEAETSQETEPQVERKTEPITEDAKHDSEKSEAIESPVDQDAEESLEADTSRATEPRCKTELIAGEPCESLETNTTQVVEFTVEQQTAHNTEEPSEAETSLVSEPLTEPEAETKTKESSEAETSQVSESLAEDKTEPKAADVVEPSETETSQVMESEVEQQNEHKTGDVGEYSEEEKSRDFEPEVDQETEAKTEDAEAMRVSGHESEDKTEPKTSGEEIRVSNEKAPSENVLSEVANEEPKVETCLQGQTVKVLLTEPENNEDAVDEEFAVKQKQRDEKRMSKADQESSDPLSKNPNAWIMVQHLEMNEEITRQLGNMLSINAFKRANTCCTIM